MPKMNKNMVRAAWVLAGGMVVSLLVHGDNQRAVAGENVVVAEKNAEAMCFSAFADKVRPDQRVVYTPSRSGLFGNPAFCGIE